MLRARTPAAVHLRCPWCQGEGGQEPWVRCERDATPIHAACLAEFGVCPICREPVPEASQAAPEGGRPTLRIAPPGRTEVAAPPPVVAAWAAALRDDYRSLLARGPALATWTACTALAVGALALASGWLATVALALSAAAAAAVHAGTGRPRVAALLPVDAPASAELRALAAAIVEGDREALRASDRRARAARTVAALRRRLERLEADRLDHHRRALERETPIEDAQRIRGIGEGITSALRAHGVSSLADLLRRRSLQAVPLIGPRRAALLATWADDRTAAIGRLVRGGPFAGRADLDRRFDAAALEPVRREAAHATAEADQALAGLVAWAAARPALRERLARALARADVD
ncbi:MAG: hypothetical protein M9894_17245 [Planctomycetes bacterium]|nr:hypothetical protein [Planctomycetota bacterium]